MYFWGKWGESKMKSVFCMIVFWEETRRIGRGNAGRWWAVFSLMYLSWCIWDAHVLGTAVLTALPGPAASKSLTGLQGLLRRWHGTGLTFVGPSPRVVRALALTHFLITGKSFLIVALINQGSTRAIDQPAWLESRSTNLIKTLHIKTNTT